jgi:hypothetical protein
MPIALTTAPRLAVTVEFVGDVVFTGGSGLRKAGFAASPSNRSRCAFDPEEQSGVDAHRDVVFGDDLLPCDLYRLDASIDPS